MTNTKITRHIEMSHHDSLKKKNLTNQETRNILQDQVQGSWIYTEGQPGLHIPCLKKQNGIRGHLAKDRPVSGAALQDTRAPKVMPGFNVSVFSAQLPHIKGQGETHARDTTHPKSSLLPIF